MIIDHENLSAMLNVENSERQANWNQFFLYENNEILTQGELNHEKIFVTSSESLRMAIERKFLTTV